MLTPEAIAELRELAAKATPGPWEVDEAYISAPPAGRAYSLARMRGYEDEADSNAALIVALRNSLDDLLAAAEAVAVMKGALEEYAKPYNWFVSGGNGVNEVVWSPKGSFDDGCILAQAALAKVAAKEQA